MLFRSAQDLRMIPNKVVQKALDMSASDARTVQDAINRAYLQVPLTIRGMGDKAVDFAYGLPGSSAVMGRYLRVQGAARYAFNPFFAYLRLIPKTEILTESEGGGFLRSIFTGRSGQIADVRGLLRSNGMFEERAATLATGGSETGEAAEYSGQGGR